MSLSAATKPQVVIAGASGYIGKFVVKESVRRGYDTVAIIRNGSTPNSDFFKGATVVVGDVTNEDSLSSIFPGDNNRDRSKDAIISCLASRSGVKDDSYKVDYQATLNTLNAAKSKGVGHFVLLSAFCVRKPLLQFQWAKLKFEDELIKSSDKITHSIVRPTAFFKSVSGQFELLQQGWPFIMFGDGEICRCNPISETDLATFLVDCVESPERKNQILEVGGPDEGMTMLQQGNMMFEVLGKEPKFWNVPVGLFDLIINTFEFLSKIFPKLSDAAELSRIGKYYAVEDMLTVTPEKKFGKITLRQHYERILVEGQEYDPYTTMLASRKPVKESN
eukprot:gene11617-15556_t